MASNKRGFEAPQYPFRLLSVTSGTSRRAYRPSMQRHRSMSAFGVERTSKFKSVTSAFDPIWTSVVQVCCDAQHGSFHDVVRSSRRRALPAEKMSAELSRVRRRGSNHCNCRGIALALFAKMQ